MVEDEIIDYKTGIRVHQASTVPYALVGSIDKKHWYSTALGSHGLIYHAHFGEILAKHILRYRAPFEA